MKKLTVIYFFKIFFNDFHSKFSVFVQIVFVFLDDDDQQQLVNQHSTNVQANSTYAKQICKYLDIYV